MGQGRYHFDWNLVGPAGLYWRNQSDSDQKFSEYALQPVIFSCLAGQFGAKVHTGGILHVPIFTWDPECYKWLSLEASLMPTLANPSRSQFDRVTSAQVVARHALVQDAVWANRTTTKHLGPHPRARKMNSWTMTQHTVGGKHRRVPAGTQASSRNNTHTAVCIYIYVYIIIWLYACI